jgi:hypothetical protein
MSGTTDKTKVTVNMPAVQLQAFVFQKSCLQTIKHFEWHAHELSILPHESHKQKATSGAK